MPNHVIDLVGQRFGRLLVISRASNVDGRTAWSCRCDCGVLSTVSSSGLRHKGTQSCGCLIIEKATKHGHNRPGKRSRTYSAWVNLRERCANPKNRFFADYGGRGISYDERWNSFTAFLEDMGECPDGMSIDRIDNDKGYSKENCRWATPDQQANNKRDNVVFEGKTLAQWSDFYGVHRQTIYSRFYRTGSVHRS